MYAIIGSCLLESNAQSDWPFFVDAKLEPYFLKVEKDLRAGVVVGTISDNLEDEPAHNLPFINKKKNKIQARAPKVVAF